MARTARSTNIVTRVRRLREACIKYLGMDIQITLIPLSSPDAIEKKKAKVFKQDGWCDTHLETHVEAGNSCPECVTEIENT